MSGHPRGASVAPSQTLSRVSVGGECALSPANVRLWIASKSLLDGRMFSHQSGERRA